MYDMLWNVKNDNPSGKIQCMCCSCGAYLKNKSGIKSAMINSVNVTRLFANSPAKYDTAIT